MAQKEDSEISRACLEIQSMVWNYYHNHRSPPHQDVREATKNLSLEDFAKLYDTLHEISSKSGSDRLSTQETWMSAAEHDKAFGKLTPHMADYYDNEIAVAYSEDRQFQRAVRQIQSLVEEVERERKKQKA